MKDEKTYVINKTKKMFITISVMVLISVFLKLCVIADGYIEEINYPSNIPVTMGSVFELKDVISVYPSSEELKSSLRYYSQDTDVARIVLFRSTSSFRAQHWMRQNSDGTWSHKLGTSQCISNVDASGNIILDPLTCNMHYTEVGDIFDYEYVACFLVKTVN